MNKKTLGRNDSDDDDFTMSMRSEPLGYTVKSQQLNNFSVHITGDIRDAEYYTKIFELCLDAGENDYRAWLCDYVESNFVPKSDYEKLKAQLERAESQKHDLIQYCMKHEQFQFMWAATILSIIFECDFRDSYNQARQYFKEKEQV